MLNSKLENLISFLKTKKILIGTHDLVDLDGYASCIVLKYVLNHHFNIHEVSLFFTEFSKGTSQFLEKITKLFPGFDFSCSSHADLSSFDLLLLLDMNNLNLVKINGKEAVPFIYIDHHVESESEYENNLSSYNITLNNYSSTAEIIFDICEICNVILPTALKWLLISAILTDSGYFKYGNNHTVITASKLLDNEIDIQQVFLLMKSEEDISKKVAKIKGLQRVRLLREGNYLIGVSNVSNFEASVANALLSIGFDVSIILAKKKAEYRITMRATKQICMKTGLHLGKILGELSILSGGNAGGHDGAASLNGQENQEEVLEAIIGKVKEIINA